MLEEVMRAEKSMMYDYFKHFGQENASTFDYSFSFAFLRLHFANWNDTPNKMRYFWRKCIYAQAMFIEQELSLCIFFVIFSWFLFDCLMLISYRMTPI